MQTNRRTRIGREMLPLPKDCRDAGSGKPVVNRRTSAATTSNPASRSNQRSERESRRSARTRTADSTRHARTTELISGDISGRFPHFFGSARRISSTRMLARLEVTAMAQKAKLFKSGGSQAVQLPKELRLESEEEVLISQQGDRVILEPIKRTWSQEFLELAGSAPDFPYPEESRVSRAGT